MGQQISVDYSAIKLGMTKKDIEGFSNSLMLNSKKVSNDGKMKTEVFINKKRNKKQRIKLIFVNGLLVGGFQGMITAPRFGGRVKKIAPEILGKTVFDLVARYPKYYVMYESWTLGPETGLNWARNKVKVNGVDLANSRNIIDHPFLQNAVIVSNKENGYK